MTMQDYDRSKLKYLIEIKILTLNFHILIPLIQYLIKKLSLLIDMSQEGLSYGRTFNICQDILKKKANLLHKCGFADYQTSSNIIYN